MFKEARIKLTTWYLLVIMAISLSFSGVIYAGVNRELLRIENSQNVRIQGIIHGFPVPVELPPNVDSDSFAESRTRILLTLGIINLSILILSGLGGYFLAGITLDPIKEMVDKQKEFVSNASHELRTPLTSLTTEIEVALRDKRMTLKDTKELLSSNLEEVKKMNNLSNNLLRLNRSENSDSRVGFKQVDLRNIVLNAIDKVIPIAVKSKIKITQKLQSAVVLGDEDSLTELAVILLDNAIKYSGDGREIIVKTKSSGTLSVQDFGIGIRKQDLPHVFDRFYRADSSRNKEKTNGYGLGLSIAESISNLHNASIKVESEVGNGSTFTVTF